MNDERLAQRAAAGDEAAFEAIFRRYHQDLYRYCLATVGNAHDAQDALQNTMVKAMQALPGERREIKLKPWLYRVARNEAVETLRRRREGIELDAERETSSWEIADSTANRERLRQLLADLEQLPERQRSALVMRELAGFGFEEIGAAFDTSAAVARQTLYEARLSLRQMKDGREMRCEAVMKALSDADGRIARRRDLRAHLRDCASCRAFSDEIGQRRGELAAIAPLPVAVSAGLLQALGGGSATATAGVAGAVGAGVGKTAATATIVKSAATFAVVAAVGVSAADRGGVIDLPLGGDKSEDGQSAPQRLPGTGDGDSEAATGAESRPAASTGKPETGAPAEADTAAGPADVASGQSGGGADATSAGDQGSSSQAAAPGKSESAPAGRPKNDPAGGRSQAGGGQGPPEQLPPASSRGQETAAAHKPPHANPSPAAAHPPGQAAKPEQPPKGEGAAVAPVPPQAAAPEAGKGGGNGNAGGNSSSGGKGKGANGVEPDEP